MSEFVRDKDGKDVTVKGVFARHGIEIVVSAALGAAVGVGVGYAISVHTGMSRAWCMGIGGFAGFAIIGGITYAVFHAIDKAELAAEQYAKQHLRAVGVEVPTSNPDEQAAELGQAMADVLRRFGFAERDQQQQAA